MQRLRECCIPLFKRWRYLFVQKKDDVWSKVFQIFRRNRLPKTSNDPTHPYPIKDPTRHDPLKIIAKRKDVFTQKKVEPTTEKKTVVSPKSSHKKIEKRITENKTINLRVPKNKQKKHQDSLTLLHVLLELQRRSPVKFTVSAATVNPETPEFSPEPLIVPWIHGFRGGEG